MIADSTAIVCAALSALLSMRHRVLGAVESAAELVFRLRDGGADIVVVDPELPGDIGSALRALRGTPSSVSVLLLTASTDRALIGAALSAGANGYVSKHDPPEQLFEAIERLVAGEAFVSDALAPIFDTGEQDVLVPVNTAEWDLLPEPVLVDSNAARLTEREREILVWVAHGANSHEIGARLNISAQTVRKHRENLRRKLGAHNTAQVTAYAIRAGLIGEG